MYPQGQGVPQSENEAAVGYRQASDQVNTGAQFKPGVLYDQGRGVPQSDKENAVKFRKTADQDDAGAYSNLRVIYENGRDVPMNIATTLTWFRKAAAQGFQKLLSSRPSSKPCSLCLLEWGQWNAPTAEPWRPLVELPSGICEVQIRDLLRRGVPNRALEGAWWAHDFIFAASDRCGPSALAFSEVFVSHDFWRVPSRA